MSAPEQPLGGVSTPSVVLDSIVFAIGVLLLGGLHIWIGKRILFEERCLCGACWVCRWGCS